MKKIPELKSEEDIVAFWDEHDSTEYIDWNKAMPMCLTKLQKSVISLVCEIKEAKEQIEIGKYISIDEAFDRVIAKYEE